MKLNIEISQSYRLQRWVWRVRSDDTRNGEACLAIGTVASEDKARRIGCMVRDSLAPIFDPLTPPPEAGAEG